jgi:hypothetical protein
VFLDRSIDAIFFYEDIPAIRIAARIGKMYRVQLAGISSAAPRPRRLADTPSNTWLAPVNVLDVSRYSATTSDSMTALILS